MKTSRYSKYETHYRAEEITKSSHMICIYMDKELNDMLQSIQDKTKQSKSEIMRLALRQFQSKRLALLDKYKLEG